jgi:hypothetical protein
MYFTFLPFNRTNIIQMAISVSQRINILCIMFKIIVFFLIALFARLYVRVGILLTCMEITFHYEDYEGVFGSMKLVNFY